MAIIWLFRKQTILSYANTLAFENVKWQKYWPCHLKCTKIWININLSICSRSFDKAETGFIGEDVFKQIMSAKDDINEEDISEMLDEYYR